MPPRRTAGHLAAGYWGVLAAVGTVALAIQLVVTLRGGEVLLDEATPPGEFTRTLRYVSYFTVESNILCAATSFALARDPRRDGPAFRVLRLAAVLGITVTGVVYVVALRPLVDLDGIDAVTNVVFHYLVPAGTVLGWLVLGPRPRASWRTLGLVLVWPVVWLAYTLVHGALSGWYPYPFLDPADGGYGTVATACVLVTVLMAAVGGLLVLGDRRLPPDYPASREYTRSPST